MEYCEGQFFKSGQTRIKKSCSAISYVEVSVCFCFTEKGAGGLTVLRGHKRLKSQRTSTYMGKGVGRKPKCDTFVDQKKRRRSVLRADLRYNFSLIHHTQLRHVFYILPSCGDMGVGQPTPCPRMKLPHFRKKFSGPKIMQKVAELFNQPNSFQNQPERFCTQPDLSTSPYSFLSTQTN